MHNNDREILKGENPSILWTQLYDYLLIMGRTMRTEYTKRIRNNDPITWTELDVANKEIHDKLDYLLTWNNDIKNESINPENNLFWIIIFCYLCLKYKYKYE